MATSHVGGERGDCLPLLSDSLQILEYGLLSPWLWRSTDGSPAINSSGRKIARTLSAKSYGRESWLFRNPSLWWRCQKTVLVLCSSSHTYKTTNWRSFRSVSSWWNSHSLMVTLYVVVNVPETPALWNLILFPCAFIRLCLWWSLVLNRQKAASSVEQEQCAIFNFMCNESTPALTVHWCMKCWPIKPCGLCVAGQQVSLVCLKIRIFKVKLDLVRQIDVPVTCLNCIMEVHGSDLSLSSLPFQTSYFIFGKSSVWILAWQMALLTSVW